MASAARNVHKIFVGNIPWSVGHKELQDFFREFGRVVSATVSFDKTTGRSRGFGFVLFADDSNIAKKLANSNRLLLEGQYLTINPTDSESSG